MPATPKKPVKKPVKKPKKLKTAMGGNGKKRVKRGKVPLPKKKKRYA